MYQEELSFPHGFLWGSATAAHQVEGGNTNNNWHVWEHTSGKIAGAAIAGLACDWWNGRWQEDLAHAAQDGQNTHRLSVEWSRIEPQPGAWDEAALQHYRTMLQGIIRLGLKPFITLHHFTDPIWIYEKGGWENEETVEHFARYVEKTVAALGDLTDLWVTINEPTVYAFSGYMTAEFPPGKSDARAAFQVMRNMVKGHARAYRIIHQLQPHAMVGFAKHFRAMAPARPAFPLDRWVTNFSYNSFNNAFADALATGKLKFALWKASIPDAIATQDYVGVNYYTRDLIKFKPLAFKDIFQERYYDPHAPLSENDFIADLPIGFYESLQWAQRYGLPIYVTENGVEDSRDVMRPHYLVAHLYQLWKALHDGMDIRGYMHWSQVDNFEWERAWTQRFGLWGLDVKTQQRVRRPSVDIYREICTRNAIPLDLIRRHAPELLDVL